MKYRQTFTYRLFSACLSVILAVSLTVPAQAQSVLNLPQPGTLIGISPAYVPVLLKGMTIHPEDPLRFDFIIDSGNTNFTHQQIEKESERLVKYFLAAMTIPKNDLWVNLSPYENDRIIPEELGKTELGRDMLAQDYILKQLTASLMYPEKELGKKFWDKIYTQAQTKFDTSEIPMNTFNKVWILPESATVYENGQTVYIVKSHLKVMLNQDYMAMQHSHNSSERSLKGKIEGEEPLSVSSQIVREIILPEIEREVNEGKNFAPLRQIYHSLILSQWYKETIKESLLSKVYVDQRKMDGVELDDRTLKDQIYGRYMEAYKKGVFNYIKEDYDQLSQEVIPRKYFSGGEEFNEIPLEKTLKVENYDLAMIGEKLILGIELRSISSDQAMIADSEQENIRNKGIIFDVDGTLHSNKELNRVYRDEILYRILPTLKGWDYEEAKSRYEDRARQLKEDVGKFGVREILESFGIDWTEALQTMDKLSEQVNPGDYLSRDNRLRARFEALSKTHKIAVLSNNGHVLIDKTLEALGIREFVDVIITRTELGERIKPNPEAFNRALEELGLSAVNVIVVGDDVEKDIHPAVALGLKAELVDEDRKVTDIVNGILSDTTLSGFKENNGDLIKTLQLILGETVSEQQLLRSATLFGSAIAYVKGQISGEDLRSIINLHNEKILLDVVSDVNVMDVWQSVSQSDGTDAKFLYEITLPNGKAAKNSTISLGDIELTVQYLKSLALFIKNTRGTSLKDKDGINELNRDQGLSEFRGSSIIIVRDDKGKLRVLADSSTNEKRNIRLVPDLDEDGINNPLFVKETEAVSLHANEAEKLNIKYFKGWEMLPNHVRDLLKKLFDKNVVPLTYSKGERIDGLDVLLETQRQHHTVTGRTGQLLMDDHLNIVEDENGVEFVLEFKGVGPYDGTFETIERKINRGTVGGETLYTTTQVGLGYLSQSNAEDNNEHLQALANAPGNVISLYPIPVFQLDFEIEGKPFSLQARLSPGNRRMGQYWSGTSVSGEDALKSAAILGRSTANMLLEDRPVVHRAFMLENFFDPTSYIAAYANAGSVTYLHEQRRSFDYLKTFLTMAEERIMYKYGKADGEKYVELTNEFWNAFIEMFLNITNLSNDTIERLNLLKDETYSQEKRDQLLSVIWNDYIAPKIVDNRDRYGYKPNRFSNPTYSGELELLPRMKNENDWIDDEIKFYDLLARTRHGKRNKEKIMKQRNALLASVAYIDPVRYLSLLRKDLEREFLEDISQSSEGGNYKEIEEIRDAMLGVLDQIEKEVLDGNISPLTNFNIEHDTIPDATLQTFEDREKRIGVLALTGDPIHWGHIYSALRSMVLYRLDKVVFISTGQKAHKPGMLSGEHRHEMIKRAIQRFAPFLSYSSVGYNSDRPGEDNMFEFLDLNKESKTALYYLRGDESKNKIIRIMSDLIDKHAAKIKSANKSRIGIAFMNFENNDEEITESDPRIEVLNEGKSARFISSTRAKGNRSLFLVPQLVRDYISDNQLYVDEKTEEATRNVNRISITGATGDIGGGFAQMFRNRGGNVKALVREESKEKAERQFGTTSESLEYVDGDLLDFEAMSKLIDSTDVVYHFGALVGQYLDHEASNVMAANAFGTAILVKAMKEKGSEAKVVYASSQRVYKLLAREDIKSFLDEAYRKIEVLVGKVNDIPKDNFIDHVISLSEELTSSMPPDVNIYDISKLIGELFVRNLNNFVIARISNAYGPGYQGKRLINRVVAARLKNEKAIEKNETRDFIYADDLNEILLKLGQEINTPSEMDLASGLQTSMEKVKQIIEANSPEQDSQISFTGQEQHTAHQNSTYAERLLGRSFTDLETGLRNTLDEHKNRQQEDAKSLERDVIVIDIGGTSLRIGIYDKEGRVKGVKKVASPNFLRTDDNVSALQSKLISGVKQLIEELRGEFPSANLNTISIAFPGPVNNEGIITGAATLWGKSGEGIKYDIAASLKQNIDGIEDVYILNDNSAAALRYAKERQYNNISVVTVSSGISHKMYLREQGGLVMDNTGLTGEIGHLKVDFDKNALTCDCGGEGHLGAVSSGRGAERLAQQLAEGELSEVYRTSILFNQTDGNPQRITNNILVPAIRDGDEFALEILDRTTRYLSDVLANIAVSASIDKFVLVGGFAQAVGETYVNSLNKNLRRHDFYGREEGYSESLVELGESDDMDNLAGMGYFAEEQLQRGDQKVSEVNRGDRGGELTSVVQQENRTVNFFTQGVFSLGNTLLAESAEGRQVMIFVDKNVYETRGREIEQYFKTNKNYFTSYKIVQVDGSEKNKNLTAALDVVNRSIEGKLNRKGILIAIGGGALMDTVGFAAQIYRRGVDYIRVPTTLLGIVDAGVGVKVGINYAEHKNFLGGFYPPAAVISDVELIRNLSSRQLRGGIAEILKVALISNASLFEQVEQLGGELSNQDAVSADPYQFESILKEAAEELLDHLQRDFLENDLMRHVDFGHAFAHTFENASQYELTHGEAVGIDILLSSHIAVQRGIITEKEFNRIVNVFKKVGLPFSHPSVTIEVLMKGVESYTAHKGGKMLMVIPKSIGQTQFIDAVSRKELEIALNYINDQSDSAMLSKVGGIDLNEIEVDRQGSGVNIRFNPATIHPILDSDVDGFAPVIINLTPIYSIMPLLGLESKSRKEEYEMSSLN